MEEIRLLKQDYVESGGQNQTILQQIQMLQEEVKTLEFNVPNSYSLNESSIHRLERKNHKVIDESSDSEAEEIRKIGKDHRKAMMMLRNEKEILTEKLEIDKMRKMLPPQLIPENTVDTNTLNGKGTLGVTKDKNSVVQNVNASIAPNMTFVKGVKGSNLNVEPLVMRSDTSVFSHF